MQVKFGLNMNSWKTLYEVTFEYLCSSTSLTSAVIICHVLLLLLFSVIIKKLCRTRVHLSEHKRKSRLRVKLGYANTFLSVFTERSDFSSLFKVFHRL